MSGTGPEVVSGSKQRPERVSIPTIYFLLKSTHLRHQTCYALFLVKITILLCFQTSRPSALDLVQVKAHDIRAFTVPKALYGWVLVDQNHASLSLETSHTFTTIFLKDLHWSENNNIYLGILTAA